MSDVNNIHAFVFDLLVRSGKIAIAEQLQIVAEHKTDRSIVTNADKKISDFIYQETAGYRANGHVLFDEEIIDRDNIKPDNFFKSETPYVWFVDPIAGTSCYAAGLPLYAISIGIFKNKKPFVGGVFFPALEELYLSDGADSWFYHRPNI